MRKALGSVQRPHIIECWGSSLLSLAEEPSTAFFHLHEQPHQQMDLASKIWGRTSGEAQPFPGQLYLDCLVCVLLGLPHQPLETLHRLNDLLPDYRVNDLPRYQPLPIESLQAATSMGRSLVPKPSPPLGAVSNRDSHEPVNVVRRKSSLLRWICQQETHLQPVHITAL